MVARALLIENVFARRTGTNLFGVVNALGDIGRLSIETDQDAHGLAVIAVGLAVVTNSLDRVAHNARDIDITRSCDFAGDDGQACGHEGLTCDTTHWVVGQHGIENGIGDLISHLVGMTLGDRF
ncbi:unannotated protein [freshwater metagenome]|uniref:Unannotated protein n=1 Tax=freshwater metagenome TaxID=449393 RepID=A0A6J7LDC4_9ZZZZ